MARGTIDHQRELESRPFSEQPPIALTREHLEGDEVPGLGDLVEADARRKPDDLKRYLQGLARDVQTQQLTRRVSRLLAKASIG